MKSLLRPHAATFMLCSFLLSACANTPGSPCLQGLLPTAGVARDTKSTSHRRAAVAQPSHPSWLNSAVIYNAYTDIFSQKGNFASLTAQLPSIRNLGFNVLWLMPISPIGQPYTGHPAFNSPYAIQDHTAINPKYGTSADLTTLVTTAHGLGLKVILDEPLNDTSWDNPLITQHPEYYAHSDGNVNNPNSIEQAFNDADIAQFDYTRQTGLQSYLTNMLKNWIVTYDIDGFRFDMPDNPPNDGRKIPASFWQALRPQIESVKPEILMLGEEEDPALTTQPFELDYGWQLQSALQQATTSGNPAGLQIGWQGPLNAWPSGALHMSILQDWDLGEDVQIYGGTANTMDAAVLNFTINGVPMLFNGEEVGNDNSAINTHAVIDWNSPNAAIFTRFYTSLINLRNANTSLQQGYTKWLTTSTPSQVVAYDRWDNNSEFLIVINFSNSDASGTLPPELLPKWTDVTPPGSPGGQSHIPPPNFSLRAHDFAIFQRNTSSTTSFVPTSSPPPPLPSIGGAGSMSTSQPISSCTLP